MNEKHEIQDEMILITSDEAATYRKNIEGWVSRQGHYYGEKGENSARYEGCTHRPCQECGEPAEKTWLYCKECRDKRDIDRYNKREKKVWDGEAWLYSELLQDYIGPDNLDDWFEDNTIEELMLVICEPRHCQSLTMAIMIATFFPKRQTFLMA